MPFDEPPDFDLAEFTPKKTLARISEIRTHLRDDLFPAVAEREDVAFITPFLAYLDSQAARFAEWVNAPLDLLAIVIRNLLEYSILLPVVFDTQENKTLFLNEAYLDLQDLDRKLTRIFSKIGATVPRTSDEERPDWLPFANDRLTGQRDPFDSWVYKFCSKIMHPTAIRVLAPDALLDPPKRLTLCFVGLQYLGRCFNLLSDEVLSSPHSTERTGDDFSPIIQ